MPIGRASGVVTLEGEGGIEQILRRAVSYIEALGLDVIAVIDHSGDAADAGITLPESKLVIFASPDAATRLILSHPLAALDLPPKVLIHEGANGRVLVSFHTSGSVALRYALTDGEADALRVAEAVACIAAGVLPATDH